jgi:hypothetical protein
MIDTTTKDKILDLIDDLEYGIGKMCWGSWDPELDKMQDKISQLKRIIET